MGNYQVILIGASSGGINALEHILKHLPLSLLPPIIIVQHISPDAGQHMVKHFKQVCPLPVLEAEDGATMEPHTVYVAPPGYHLQIEPNKTFSLCVGEKVCYSRPSIDVLFETAAKIFGAQTLAIILTGANNDGTRGAELVKRLGGTVIVQDPRTAEANFMPQSVINAGFYDKILPLAKIADLLHKQEEL